jgi:predicted RNA binding protein YcfA (HicA-like mRNA interferase family)
MPKLPVLSGRDLIAILKDLGFVVVRQKGSHVSLLKGQFKTVVPLHADLAKGTIISILKQCGLSKDEIIR